MSGPGSGMFTDCAGLFAGKPRSNSCHLWDRGLLAKQCYQWNDLLVIPQVRCQPAFTHVQVLALARGVAFDLILVDLAHCEVLRLWVAKYQPLTAAAGNI